MQRNAELTLVEELTGWIGVDLDGTLCKKAPEEAGFDPLFIGEPIPMMVERVKAWLTKGIEVRILTARAAGAEPEVLEVIDEWVFQQFGKHLKITAEKDPDMIALWDDKAVTVAPDTGSPADPRSTSLADEHPNVED